MRPCGGATKRSPSSRLKAMASKRALRADRPQPALHVLLADHARGLDFELALEAGLGKGLAPGPGIAQQLRGRQRDLRIGQRAIGPHRIIGFHLRQPLGHCGFEGAGEAVQVRQRRSSGPPPWHDRRSAR